MPIAACKNCKHKIHWRNQRGTRLASIRCQCGGEFEAVVWSSEENGYVARRIMPRKSLGNVIQCALCGLRRMPCSGNVRILMASEQYEVHVFKHPKFLDSVTVVIPPGSGLCWWHNQANIFSLEISKQKMTPLVAAACKEKK